MEYVKYWAGKWSLLTCSYFVAEYTNVLKKYFGQGLNDQIIIIKEGHSSCFQEKKDLIQFQIFLAKKIRSDQRFVQELCGQLKKESQKIKTLLRKLLGKDLCLVDYQKYEASFDSYVAPHVGVKNAPTFLTDEESKKYFHQFKEASIYAEDVYTKTEEFISSFAEILSKKKNVSSQLILSMTKEEFRIFLDKGKMPSQKILKQRFTLSVLKGCRGKVMLQTGRQAQKQENTILGVTSSKFFSGNLTLRGKAAYPGKVIGRVRIIVNPEGVTDFKDGDILVTGMTRPNFIQLMKKAGGIVTDAGGVLCHAALVARELKKPCLIGTEKATTLFKDGDNVEIDADKGIVKKLG